MSYEKIEINEQWWKWDEKEEVLKGGRGEVRGKGRGKDKGRIERNIR